MLLRKSIQRREWHQQMGLDRYAPFDFIDAAEEQAHLPEYFSPPLFWDDLFRDTSHLIHGPWGSGKTALRIMLAQELRDRKKNPNIQPFIVVCKSFEQLATLKTITPTDCAEYILAAAADTFLQEIADVRIILEDKDNSVVRSKALDNLFALLLRYYRPNDAAIYKRDILNVYNQRVNNHIKRLWQRLRLWLRLRAKSNALAHLQSADNSTVKTIANIMAALFAPGTEIDPDPMKKMRFLVETATSLGYSQVIVLLDNIDSLAGHHDNYELMAQILNPFLQMTATHMKEVDGISFKFLAPTDVYARSKFRTDKLEVHLIRWKDSELLNLIDRRIKSASFNKKSELKHLIRNGEIEKFIGTLLSYSLGTPRNAYRILRRTIDYCCEYFDGDIHLSLEHLLKALSDFFDDKQNREWLEQHKDAIHFRLISFFPATWQTLTIRQLKRLIETERGPGSTAP